MSDERGHSERFQPIAIGPHEFVGTSNFGFVKTVQVDVAKSGTVRKQEQPLKHDGHIPTGDVQGVEVRRCSQCRFRCKSRRC